MPRRRFKFENQIRRKWTFTSSRQELGRIPPLHINCAACTKPTHKRCTSKALGTFLCVKCVKKAASNASSNPPNPERSSSAIPEPTSSILSPPNTESSCPPEPPSAGSSAPPPAPLPARACPPHEESASSTYFGMNSFAKVCPSGPGAARHCCEEALLSEPDDFQGMLDRGAPVGYRKYLKFSLTGPYSDAARHCRDEVPLSEADDFQGMLAREAPHLNKWKTNRWQEISHWY